MAAEIVPSVSLGAGAQTLFASKQVTFTGAANLGAVGTVPWFTTTGVIHIVKILGYVNTNLAGATATLALGVTGSTSAFIGATTATTLLTTAPIWMSTTATANVLAIPSGVQNFITDQNIIGTVATAAVSSGAITLYVEYKQVSAGSGLA